MNGNKRKVEKAEEKVDAPSANVLNGFRLPSLRDCAGMTGGAGGVGGGWVW